MRIDAGSHRGVKLVSQDGLETRPTADRARQAVFNILMNTYDAVRDAKVLDVFAGSGAMGLEALSRGAERASFIERDRGAADAIKKTEDGVVQSSLKPRCIACSNCVLACPFGIPKVMLGPEQMMKCDMCYDRTSEGRRPMCATVCPSQALAYLPPEQVARERRERATNVFQFGNQRVTTKVFMMVPPSADAVAPDVVDYMWEQEA